MSPWSARDRNSPNAFTSLWRSSSGTLGPYWRNIDWTENVKQEDGLKFLWLKSAKVTELTLDIWSLFQNHFVWELISNARNSVSSQYQSTSKFAKKYFTEQRCSNSLLSVWHTPKHSVSCVYCDCLLKTRFKVFFPLSTIQGEFFKTQTQPIHRYLQDQGLVHRNLALDILIRSISVLPSLPQKRVNSVLLKQTFFFSFGVFIEGCYVLNPLFKSWYQNSDSYLQSLYVSYKSTSDKLLKYQLIVSCVIMSLILITNLFYKSLISRGEISYWTLLELKGLNSNSLLPFPTQSQGYPPHDS